MRLPCLPIEYVNARILFTTILQHHSLSSTLTVNILYLNLETKSNIFSKDQNREGKIQRNLQGSFSMRGAATSRRIHETIRERAKSPQQAILADLRLIPETTVRHASQAHAAQHDARHEAAHIFSNYNNYQSTRQTQKPDHCNNDR